MVSSAQHTHGGLVTLPPLTNFVEHVMGISKKDGVIGSAHARWLGDFPGLDATTDDDLGSLPVSRLMCPRCCELTDASQLISQ